MIKFFRRIRAKLIAENKLGKYLLYALGEIVLVVIGILIALGINTWNEEKKNKATEAQYYCLILEDLDKDYSKIQELMLVIDKNIEVSRELLLELNEGSKDKKYLLNKFLIAFRGEAFVSRNATYKDLISSGKIGLLQDLSIKNSLIEFYSELENKMAHIQQNSDESAKVSFEMVNTSLAFGLAEFDYVSDLLGEDIKETLPQSDWTKDSESEFYQNFQMTLVFNMTMKDRNKQVMNEILELIEVPRALLTSECSN